MDDDLQVGGCLFAATLILGLIIWVISSHMEASAFNHATGKNVSTWDAMFIELRIQESAK